MGVALSSEPSQKTAVSPVDGTRQLPSLLRRKGIRFSRKLGELLELHLAVLFVGREVTLEHEIHRLLLEDPAGALESSAVEDGLDDLEVRGSAALESRAPRVLHRALGGAGVELVGRRRVGHADLVRVGNVGDVGDAERPSKKRRNGQ